MPDPAAEARWERRRYGTPLVAEMCMFCTVLVHPVKVHGHLQCPRCNNVLEKCCEGISLEKVSETA